MMPGPGQIIGGRFRMLHPLGEGGMAAVYAAEQVDSGRPVALKVMRPHISLTPGFTERFLREAQVLGRLRHPGSVELYAHGLDEDLLYIAMELVSGETVKALRMREGALSIPRVVCLGVQVLDALEAAHALGVVHRDIKPSNLFLSPHAQGERVKVLDFGLAALVGGPQPQSRLTQKGMAVGTLGFMPPEQMRGLPLDGRSDLYALGCVLYELLTGEPPFAGLRKAELAAAHLCLPVLPPCQLRPELPERLEALVLRALEKEPAARSPDAATMRQELLASLSGSLAVPSERRTRSVTELGQEWEDDTRPLLVAQE